MAIKAAHQAALHKQHKAQAGNPDRAAALDGVHNAFARGNDGGRLKKRPDVWCVFAWCAQLR